MVRPCIFPLWARLEGVWIRMGTMVPCQVYVNLGHSWVTHVKIKFLLALIYYQMGCPILTSYKSQHIYDDNEFASDKAIRYKNVYKWNFDTVYTHQTQGPWSTKELERKLTFCLDNEFTELIFPECLP